MLKLEINLCNKEYEKALLEHDRISDELLKLYFKDDQKPYLEWMANHPSLPEPLPIYFLLADDDEVILHIGDDLDDRTRLKSLNLNHSPYNVYDHKRPGAGFRINALIQGMYGLAMALFCDHEPHWRSWINHPSALIKDENDHFDSYPLFIPDCSFGCCGGEDLGIYVYGDRVKIIRKSGPDPEVVPEKEYVVPLDEYLDVVIRCLEELYKIGDNNSGRPDTFWFMVFLLKKASLEGREEIRKPLINKFMKFVRENDINLDGW